MCALKYRHDEAQVFNIKGNTISQGMNQILHFFKLQKIT